MLLVHALSNSPLELRFIARHRDEQDLSIHAPHIATDGDPTTRGFTWQAWVECVENAFQTVSLTRSGPDFSRRSIFFLISEASVLFTSASALL